MKRIFTLCVAAVSALTVFGQREVAYPVETIHELQRFQPKQQLAKTDEIWPLNFPITDHFINGNKPDTFYWLDSNVNIIAKTAIFNAQNHQGATYSNNDGSFGVADELTTKPLNFLNVTDRCYINFDYEMGATWQAGDSLVLQARNAAGNWDNVWRSAPIAITRRNISLDFPIGLLYKDASFALRFVCYTSRSNSNTETFKLFHVVFGLKQLLPYYENVFWDSVYTHRHTWSKMQGTKESGHDIMWGNVIKLDAFDENGVPYGNDYNDTIQSHSFDFSKFELNDSVFFRFYYRAYSNVANDSLILQFKNNGGLWVEQMAVSAAQSNGWKTFTTGVNKSRINHEDFQYRIITVSNSSSSDTLKWVVSGFNIARKEMNRFFDDFSTTNVQPNPRNWLDKSVFVNHRFPINPPSINVATFDGLNNWGAPYGFGKGACDTLTSVPIRLDKLTDADTGSTYLSFHIQPKGLGADLASGDLLILDVRFSQASPDSFRTIWTGNPRDYRTDTFTEIRFLLPREYWHDDFQLRFRNIGSRAGNLAQWHLDYVHLENNRSSGSVLRDAAIQDYPSPLLKKYSAVPYTHFKQSPNTFLTDTQYIAVRNNSNQAYAINYGREVFDQEHNRLDTFGNVFNNFQPFSKQTGGIKRALNITNHYPTDSAYIRSRFYTAIGTASDEVRSNDTIWQDTYLGNYYAYDDGTAEWSYGIENGPGKVALRYEFSQPDSMVGMSVFYARPLTDLSNMEFNLVVWESINPEKVLLKLPAKVMYQNTLNGFYYIKFAEPIYINKTVYIGWEQSQIFVMSMGLDMNQKIDYQFKPNPEMFYNTGPGWAKTSLEGALMMRPLVGKWVDPPAVGVKEIKTPKANITVYPNPSRGVFHLQTDGLTQFEIAVYDVTGKRIYAAQNTDEIDLSGWRNGMYILHVTDKLTQTQYTQKLLINQ